MSLNLENKTLREAAVELGYLTSEQFDSWVIPANMVGNLSGKRNANAFNCIGFSFNLFRDHLTDRLIRVPLF
jgi:hypothetical protein